MKYPVGICSWSLHNDPDQILSVMEMTECSNIHLDLSAIEELGELIRSQGWTISSTMIGLPQEDYSTLESIRQTGGIIPDSCWEENRSRLIDAIDKTADLGVGFLSFHAGFIDHNDIAGYQVFCGRMQELAARAGEKRIMLLLETGQETATDLRRCLEEINHPALGVNFDPANMLLYGKGDPVEGVRTLAPWIRHVHIKDATVSDSPEEWGTEVPWGDGEVDGAAFLKVLEDIGYTGTLAIEREAGNARAADIKLAVERLAAEG